MRNKMAGARDSVKDFYLRLLAEVAALQAVLRAGAPDPDGRVKLTFPSDFSLLAIQAFLSSLPSTHAATSTPIHDILTASAPLPQSAAGAGAGAATTASPHS
jgi:hypothetical protein